MSMTIQQPNSERAPFYIFDLGGVVAGGVFELRDLLAKKGYHGSLDTFYHDDLMHQFTSGKIPEAVYWQEFSRRYGIDTAGLRWGSCIDPILDTKVVSLMQELRRRGSRVVCGSNTFQPHWDIFTARGYTDYFDAVYLSHVMGESKPEPTFWLYILEREGRTPEESIFIDDTLCNVKAAAALGIRTILFTGAGPLRELLLGDVKADQVAPEDRPSVPLPPLRSPLR